MVDAASVAPGRTQGHEVFISYARADNKTFDNDPDRGWVTAIVEWLKEDARGFGEELAVFFDRTEIDLSQPWPAEIQ